MRIPFHRKRRILPSLALAATMTLGVGESARAAMDYAEIAQALLILAQEVLAATQLGTIDGSITSSGGETKQVIIQAGEDIRAVIEETAKANQNNQRKIYNERIKREQQPMPFCPEDQKVTGKIAKARTQSAYQTTVRTFNNYNASENIRLPANFEKDKNDKLKAILENPAKKCDPRIAPPINKADIETDNGAMSCTPEEIDAFIAMVTARKPLPQPPKALEGTAVGQFLKSEIDNHGSRISIVEQALAGTVNEELDLMIQAYQKLAEHPDIKTINDLSGTGATERSEAFQNQIRTQLQIQYYKELLQHNRLMALYAAQRLEDHRKYINKLIASLSTR